MILLAEPFCENAQNNKTWFNNKFVVQQSVQYIKKVAFMVKMMIAGHEKKLGHQKIPMLQRQVLLGEKTGL